jgi:hypothetical protein
MELEEEILDMRLRSANDIEASNPDSTEISSRAKSFHKLPSNSPDEVLEREKNNLRMTLESRERILKDLREQLQLLVNDVKGLQEDQKLLRRQLNLLIYDKEGQGQNQQNFSSQQQSPINAVALQQNQQDFSSLGNRINQHDGDRPQQQGK